MIHGRTLNGAKDLVLRGWLGPRGLKGFVQGRITTPGGDKIIWDGSIAPGTLTLVATPELVQGAVGLNGYAPVVTASTVVSASGGSEPYSYAWTLDSDDGFGGSWTAQYPAANGTTFRASAVLNGDTSVAIFTCTVTDARGATGTVNVTAAASNYGPFF